MESLVVSGLSAHAWRTGASSSAVALPVAFCSCRRRYEFKQGSVKLGSSRTMRRDLVIVKAEASADEPEQVPESDEKPEAKGFHPWGVLRTAAKVFGVLALGWAVLVANGLRELEKQALAEVSTFEEQQPAPAIEASATVTGEETSASVSQQNAPVSKEDEVTILENDEVMKYLNRFREHWEKRNFGAALEVVDNLIKEYPEEMNFRVLRANLYNNLGDTKMALKEYEEMLNVNPLQPQAIQGMAMVLTKQGESIEDIREKVERALGDALREKKTTQARELGLLLAQIFTLQKKLAPALQIYQKLSDEDPSDFRPHLSRALLFTFIGDSQQAEVHFRDFDRTCPKELPERQQLEQMIKYAKKEAALARRRADN